MEKDKILYLTSVFTKGIDNSSQSEDSAIESIYIEGYANTTTTDRAGDVIPKTAWNSGMENYLKNPMILAYHKHNEPIGKMVDYKIDDKGLWIKARISPAAEDVYNLIKDGVLSAFSVGFAIKDAVYDTVTDLFVIKELELLEISVVSVGMNQDSLFNLSKSFNNDEEYKQFKGQFITKQETSAKGLEQPISNNSARLTKGINMEQNEIQEMMEKATADAVTKALAAVSEKAAAEKAAAEKAAAEKAALEAQIKSIAIEVLPSGTEKLVEDLTKRLEDSDAKSSKAIEDLMATVKEKSAEIEALRSSKMTFKTDAAGNTQEGYADREKAVLLSKITGKSIEDTKFGRSIIEKAGAHVPSATWELEVSRNMESEIRRRLVMAPLFRNIDMTTNVMKIPVNPEAGFATWVANTAFGTTASPGATATHQLKEITLSAYKVSTAEYMAFEEQEDSILVLLPIIRDAMVRRVARSVDKAFLYDSTAPFTGTAAYDATSAVTVTNTGTVTVANLRALRKDLGAWGLMTDEVVYVVSQETYYDLLEDTVFMTVDKAGPAATLLTGQIGLIGNSPVLVSDAFPARVGGTSSTNTNIGAIAVAPGNFLVGNQRGVRFDTQDLVAIQSKILVASMRTGLSQISTVNGMGVSTLRHT